MFKKSNWTAPILKSDLVNVLLYGFVLSILGGILSGAINYLFFVSFKLNVTIGVFIIMLIVGFKLRTVYDSYHNLYPLLGMIFVYLGFLISNFMECLIIFQFDFLYTAGFTLSNYQFYLLPLINSDFNSYLVFRDYSLFDYILNNFMNFLYIFIATVSTIVAYIGTYKIIKGKNK